MASNNNIITEAMYEGEIPIFIERNYLRYEYKSFARGYHVYMKIWTPLIGEMLKCRREPSNEVDKNAVALIKTDSLGVKVIVGHVPWNVSNFFSMFLKVPNTSIEVEVVGKRVNRGGGYGLEIPVVYRFNGPEKLVKWLIKKIEAVRKELDCKVSKCLK
mgnify:CR=1 FL=1